MDCLGNSYIDNLVNKFDFIQGLWLTDFEGNLFMSSVKKDISINPESRDSPRSIDEVDTNSIKMPLSFIFNSIIEQSSKIEKWKTKNLTSIYDNHIIFQSKINKFIFAHFVCDVKSFNYELCREITNEFYEKLQKIEGELDNMTQLNENN